MSTVHQIVRAARSAQPSWAGLDFQARVYVLLQLKKMIHQEVDEIAKIISTETGKPLIEALAHDVMPVLDLITHFTKKAAKMLRPRKIWLSRWEFLGHRSKIFYEPHGVVGIISPGNFPFSIPVGNAVMALLAGNTVVLKPSEHSRRVTKKIQELFELTSIPRDVFSIITGNGSIGEDLIKTPCDKILFTGSVATGKKVMSLCSETLTPLNLELGGKDPMIIFEDADLELASRAAVWGAFCNCGQVCASVERLYIQQSVADTVKSLIVKKTKELRLGAGLSPTVDVGRLAHVFQLEKIKNQLQDAAEKGALILTGGKERPEFGPLFFEPTIVDNVCEQMTLMTEETFGPVLAIKTFSDDSEAVNLANHSSFALNAYVWTRNKNRARRMARQLIAGTVNINDSVLTHAFPQTPWGGPKKSGLGRTHGQAGLLDLVRIKHVHRNIFPKQWTLFWWFPYGSVKNKVMRNLVDVFSGTPKQRILGFLKLLACLFR